MVMEVVVRRAIRLSPKVSVADGAAVEPPSEPVAAPSVTGVDEATDVPSEPAAAPSVAVADEAERDHSKRKGDAARSGSVATAEPPPKRRRKVRKDDPEDFGKLTLVGIMLDYQDHGMRTCASVGVCSQCIAMSTYI